MAEMPVFAAPERAKPKPKSDDDYEDENDEGDEGDGASSQTASCQTTRHSSRLDRKVNYVDSKEDDSEDDDSDDSKPKQETQEDIDDSEMQQDNKADLGSNDSDDLKPKKETQQLEPFLKLTDQMKQKPSRSQRKPSISQDDSDVIDQQQEQEEKPKENIYELKDMQDDVKIGRYLLYLVNQPATETEIEETFFCLGIVDKEPVYEELEEAGGELGELWVHTADFVCSEDARWPQSLEDSYFHSKQTAVENWTNIWGATVVVLGIFDIGALRKNKQLGKRALQRAQSILRYYHDVYDFVEGFVNQDDGSRVKSKRKLKRKRGSPERAVRG